MTLWLRRSPSRGSDGAYNHRMGTSVNGSAGL
jgi:hypothetical protein